MASFAGLTQEQLTELQSAYYAAILAVASHQSYSMMGRSFTKADLSELRATLAEINADLQNLTGERTNFAYVSVQDC
jgi:hypothetical protein